jgi:hypothetical protein
VVKDVLRNALVIAMGIFLLVVGQRFGWVVVIVGAICLVWTWRVGYVPQTDPLLLADINRSMDLRKSDPAAADTLLGQAFDDANRRDAQRQADLLRRAKTDRRAATELRKWLRYEVELVPAVRKKAEEIAIGSAARLEALKEIDRRASDKREQLAEVEELLVDYPFYKGWRDPATEYLRTPYSLPSGGPSALFVTLIVGVFILAIVWLTRTQSEVQVRMAVSGVGVFIAILSAVRPKFFWETAGVEALRETLGDRTVVAIAVAIGVLSTVATWMPLRY